MLSEFLQKIFERYIKVGAPFCFVKYEISKTTLYTFEQIHQQILLTKFHKSLILSGSVDSILAKPESADSEKIDQLAPKTSKSHETLQGRSAGKYLQLYREFFSISTVKVKIWEISIFYKGNWNPPP